MGGGNADFVMEEAKEERDDSIPWLPGDAINELREVAYLLQRHRRSSISSLATVHTTSHLNKSSLTG